MSGIEKRLYRSRTERWLAGVCGGIGEYFNTDPTVIRVIFVLAAMILGGGILIYLVLWLVIPLAPEVFEAPVDVPEPEEE